MKRYRNLLLTAGLAAIATFSATAQRKAAQAEANHATVYSNAVKHFEGYDFEQAESELERYLSLKGADEAKAEELGRRIELGRSMIERVEKIAIIDSLTVDAGNFFKAYRLSRSAGNISDMSNLPEGLKGSAGSTVYSTEGGDHIYWGMPVGDSIRIASSSLLANGEWEAATQLDEAVNMPGAKHVSYPFVMADGVTLYFAADDPELSLGGYDIFMSRYDGEKYLESQNIGMPYNSPANDYLLAIDESTGAGWWATDRNAPEGKLTVYVFVPEEVRVNYPAETSGLTSLALVKSIAATQPSGADYTALLETLRRQGHEASRHDDDIEVALPDGRVIRNLDQLSSEASRYAMENYLDKADELNLTLGDIEDLREAYGHGDKSVANSIIEGEKSIERLRKEVKRLLNVAVSTEVKAHGK